MPRGIVQQPGSGGAAAERLQGWERKARREGLARRRVNRGQKGGETKEEREA